jgi:hypothetical protein
VCASNKNPHIDIWGPHYKTNKLRLSISAKILTDQQFILSNKFGKKFCIPYFCVSHSKQSLSGRYFYTAPFLPYYKTNNMNTLELLKKAEPIFKELDRLISDQDATALYNLIDRAEPPAEWIIELPSKIDSGASYKTIPLDLMEAAVRRIFGGSRIADTSLTISQDKGRFAVTAVVNYGYQLPNMNGMAHLIGVATVCTSDIAMMELTSPKAVSMAVKNAIKQLGGLFGKYLNRIEEAEFAIEELPKANLEDKIDSLEDCLNNCKTIDELKTYRKIVSSKSISPHIQGIYENKLRELKAAKND